MAVRGPVLKDFFPQVRFSGTWTDLGTTLTQMKKAHLSQTTPNMSSIAAVCDSLGKTSLTSLVGNYWGTDGLWVNWSPVKGEFKIFPLFLLKDNAILPMTARGTVQEAMCRVIIFSSFLYDIYDLL